MQDYTRIQGVVCPMVTPFDAEGHIDVEALRELIDFLLSHGVDVLFPGGTTGEGMLLSLQEREMLHQIVVEHSAGRCPVIVHVGCITTRDTIHLARHAEAIGATAATIITPYFYTFDDVSLFTHFSSIAEAVPELPICLYTFPGNAKNYISSALFGRLLSACPNIVAIKSSSDDLKQFQDYVVLGGDDFIPLCGVDGLMLPALSVGARGQVSGNANAFPEPFRALYDAFRAGNYDGARVQQRVINRIRSILSDGLHPAYLKAALALRGIPVGYVRPPMRELTPEERTAMESGLRELGLM